MPVAQIVSPGDLSAAVSTAAAGLASAVAVARIYSAARRQGTFEVTKLSLDAELAEMDAEQRRRLSLELLGAADEMVRDLDASAAGDEANSERFDVDTMRAHDHAVLPRDPKHRDAYQRDEVRPPIDIGGGFKVDGPVHVIVDRTTEASVGGDSAARRERAAATRLATKYHDKGLQQATFSFNLSLIFAVLGFVLIVIAVVGALATKQDMAQGTGVSLIGATIIEAVAALFFAQSNAARKLMEESFDRLRSDQNRLEALVLCESIADDRLRSRLQSLLALKLSDNAAPSSEIVALLFATDGSGPIPPLPS